MSIVCQLLLCLDVVGCWTPFDDSIQDEAGIDDGFHVGGNRPVFLDDAGNEPTRHSFAFDQVVVEWPDPITVAARRSSLAMRTSTIR